MAFNKITFTPSGASDSKEVYVEEDTTVEEYLAESEGITSFKNVTILINGSPADLEAELQNGDDITLQPKKTDSGLN